MKTIKRMIKGIIVLIFLILLFSLGIYLYIKTGPKLEIKNANSFLMYDNKDELFFQGNGSMEWVSLDNISNYVIKATINTEDKNFYKHFGFDFKRIIKALYTNISSGKTVQGASTISQQYAKNLFLNFDKTWERKFKEMWITLKLEIGYSKNEILEGYLNTINYGHGMYGIENASLFYYGKKSNDLTLGEAAMLVGIPKSPSNYSPQVNFNLAKKRQVDILYGMYKNKLITEDEYNEAVSQELVFTFKKDNINLDTVMYYQDAVMKELKNVSIPKSYLETGGIKIYTNLDLNAQQALENSIKKNMDMDNNLQVASVMMEPSSGKVIALIGGKDYNKSEYNRAYSSSRQVGSTMKPFLYYAALENGFTASTTFESRETTFNFSNSKSYSPQNAGGLYGNTPISMAQAISYSDNIYAVKTHMFLGEDVLVDIAKRVGITAKLDPVPSLPLGTASINIIEMASGYSALANEGYKVSGYLINKVMDLNGNILFERKEKRENILNKSLTYILNDLLTTTYDKNFIDYSYPTAIGIAPKIKHKLALKSGTTNTDNWSIGYNKDITCAVWVGYDNNLNLNSDDYKTRDIWVDAVEEYLKDKEDNWYHQPNNIVGVLVNPLTGKLAKANDKVKRVMFYVKGTEPKDDDYVFDELLDINQN